MWVNWRVHTPMNSSKTAFIPYNSTHCKTISILKTFISFKWRNYFTVTWIHTQKPKKKKWTTSVISESANQNHRNNQYWNYIQLNFNGQALKGPMKTVQARGVFELERLNHVQTTWGKGQQKGFETSMVVESLQFKWSKFHFIGNFYKFPLMCTSQ